MFPSSSLFSSGPLVLSPVWVCRRLPCDLLLSSHHRTKHGEMSHSSSFSRVPSVKKGDAVSLRLRSVKAAAANVTYRSNYIYPGERVSTTKPNRVGDQPESRNDKPKVMFSQLPRRDLVVRLRRPVCSMRAAPQTCTRIA